MTVELDPAIGRLFGTPPLSRIVERCREVLEREDGEIRGTISLADLDDNERAAVARVLGRSRTPSREARIRLSDIDAAVRSAPSGIGIADIVEAFGGPIRRRRTERRDEAAAREAMWVWAASQPIVEADSDLATWLADLRSTGILSRLATEELPAEAILAGAVSVLGELGPPRSLDRLASAALGSAHALDADRPVAKVVLRALAQRSGVSVPTRAEERRALWAEYEIAEDPLSARVLVAGLRPTGIGVPAAVRALADAGEAIHLTLRLINRHNWSVRDPVVWVCENPDVVQALLERESRDALLVCTEGVPSVAALALIRQLASGGAIVRVHADFDWGGITVANSVIRASGAVPWRFAAPDYSDALARAGDARLTLDPDRARTSSWDGGGLTLAMLAVGRVVEEEAVADLLIDDLVASGERPRGAR